MPTVAVMVIGRVAQRQAAEQIGTLATTRFCETVDELTTLVKDGELALDLSDDLQAGVVVTRDGSVVHPALATPAGGAADVDGAAD